MCKVEMIVLSNDHAQHSIRGDAIKISGKEKFFSRDWEETWSNPKRFPHISSFEFVRQSYDWVLPWGVSPFGGPSYPAAQDIVHALAVFPDNEGDEKKSRL
jgi:hypothetical protein